jgi:hypothetical protein
MSHLIGNRKPAIGNAEMGGEGFEPPTLSV